MAEPLPELFELEPEDVHMKKRLERTLPALRKRGRGRRRPNRPANSPHRAPNASTERR